MTSVKTTSSLVTKVSTSFQSFSVLHTYHEMVCIVFTAVSAQLLGCVCLESSRPRFSSHLPQDFSRSSHTSDFFFFCVPGHARSSVQWVRRSPQSAAASQPVPKASCGPPPDWAMSSVSSHRRWGRIAGCGWGFQDPCCMDILLSGKFSVCGGGRGVDSVQFSV